MYETSSSQVWAADVLCVYDMYVRLVSLNLMRYACEMRESLKHLCVLGDSRGKTKVVLWPHDETKR